METKEKHRARQKRWRDAHPEEHRARNKTWREANPEQERARKIKYRHGLSQDEFNAMLEAQGNVCAICGTAKWGSQGPHVDHDHKTEKIRGILCKTCNVGLGQLGDCVERIRDALGYLEQARRSS